MADPEAASPTYLADLFRTDFTSFEVYVVDGLDSIAPATEALRDDFIEDAARKRAELIEKFGVDRPTYISAEHDAAIAAYYAGITPDVSPLCQIDPGTDLEEVRRIMLSGFPDYSGADLFGGTPDSHASPGCSILLDLVFLHNLQDQYAEYARQMSGRWARPSAETLEQFLVLSGVDLVAHETGHRSRGNVLESAVLQKDPTSPTGLQATNKWAEAYDDITGILPREVTTITEGDFYAGLPLYEGMAAYHSANVVAPLREYLGPNGGVEPYDPTGRYSLYLQKNAFPMSFVPAGYAYRGLHSADCGVALEELIGKFPVVAGFITEYDQGIIDDRVFLGKLGELVPPELLQLGLTPTYTAWEGFAQAIHALQPSIDTSGKRAANEQ